MLSVLLPSSWQKHYCDVSLAKNCARAVGISSVPTMQVRGRRFPGVFNRTQFGELVGLTHLDGNSALEVEQKVLVARDHAALGGETDGDFLGGAKMGDVARLGFGNVNRRRRHFRKSRWSVKSCGRLANRRLGKFWCEFGELKDEKVEALLRSKQPLEPM